MSIRDEVKEQQDKMKDKDFKEKWDYFWEQLTVRTNLYHSKPDTSWNLPAQILIQQRHTDTGHGKLENYCTTTEAAQ